MHVQHVLVLKQGISDGDAALRVDALRVRLRFHLKLVRPHGLRIYADPARRLCSPRSTPIKFCLFG